jgi:hypothetical protein
MLENGKNVTVKDLLKILYEKACTQKLWGLVRHSAGMLGKRVEDLAKAVTDLLVRQKQITVGMPPSNEHTITAPLPENELRHLIHLVSLTYVPVTLYLFNRHGRLYTSKDSDGFSMGRGTFYFFKIV